MADLFSKPLYEIINTEKEPIKKYKPGIVAIPQYISDNLKYNFFEWQKAAFENLLIYQADHKQAPTHLMFNMATGTGKTLLMAATILYYYTQGYRYFIFFVNQNNIIDKTENNFIDKSHAKYLFKDKIVIDDETVNIRKVESFSNNPQGIEIKFTSIHKLYNDVHLEKENQTTLDDLQSKNIVMLADEAHHLNANTKKYDNELVMSEELKQGSNKALIEKKGWEHTVIELILNKNGTKENNNNVLLEFTATIPANEKVATKYDDKIIYKFDLKDFLLKGYTKEINLISSTLNKKERVLQALLFHWYRHKVALKNNIENFKPVILFRSKTIEESAADHKEFLHWIDNMSMNDFDFCKTISSKIHAGQQPTLFEMGRSRTEQVLEFIRTANISYSEIADFIKSAFRSQNIIITNSKTNKTKQEKTDIDQEKLLNNLEDKNNYIRAIFTVNRLTEGWDVLNLFDIVRLYQGQNAGGKSTKVPEATTKEKQLIGRGVRYYPFKFEQKQINKRKFDDDLNNELRILEELYYYTYDEDSKYISHLKAELKKDGYIKDDRVIKTFALKKEFIDSDFYREVNIWYNERENNKNRQKQSLADIKKDFDMSYKIRGFELAEQEVDFGEKNDNQRLNIGSSHSETKILKVKDIEKHIFQKALSIKAKQDRSLFQFDRLKRELKIETVRDLLNDKFLGDFVIKIIMNDTGDEISNNDYLNITLVFLDNVFSKLKQTIIPKIGGDFKIGKFSDFFKTPKTKSIKEDVESNIIAKELVEHKWYVLDSFCGTSEERGLINLIKDTIGNLQAKYKEVYLLRNEEVYTIYDFKKGRGFQPDFILFLKGQEAMQYQIFIEPKGDNLLEYDTWKEKFLTEISKKYGFKNIIKASNKCYRLIGLPFFNKADNAKFNQEYGKIIPIDLIK